MTAAATSQQNRPTSSADGIRWDLGDLYKGIDDPAIEADLKESAQRASAFESKYRGKIACEGGPTAGLLLEALREFESLCQVMDRPLIYAHLLHAGKTDVPAHGALMSKAQERRTEINKHLIFFDLEWIELPEEVALRLCEAPELKHYAHYLRQKRAWKPHFLSEPEEKIIQEKAVTGRSAFVRLFDETTSSLEAAFEYGGKKETLSLQQLLARLHEPDRELRKAAAATITELLRGNARLLTYIFNTLVLEHRSDCNLRKFDDPMGPRHLANEISGPVVDALMKASEQSHPTVQRYYRLKGKLLGIDQLYDYDRYAPLSGDLPRVDWPRARQIVSGSYRAFSPRAGDVVDAFFARNWIDAELRSGKRGGAFSASTLPNVHPYILMNYTDKMRDVMTLAHELGHGLHQYLSRQVGYLQCDTPLTTAETASVFGEMLTFQQLLRETADPQVRLALLCGKIEDAFATVFRQIVMTRFEQLLHRARKEQGELQTEQINALWVEANAPMHGEVVQLTEGYAWWWLYIGHFIHVPFYCYAYAFGELLVLALVQKYKEEGEGFVPRYLDMLAAGGSAEPHVLVGKLGLDVQNPSFWELGLKLLDDMVSEAESLANAPAGRGR
jgi:oligoendopeptidase F